jgi:catechol 2,3-dioxygenase-like lactoylglutathione lyase family enzyme
MRVDRRNVMGMMALLGAMPRLSFGTQPVLPLDTPGLDHLDVIVGDVEKSARFYMGLFKTTLHAQPFQGASRYFVLLNTLGAGREVGYLAIGASRGRGTYIGHFCTSVVEWRRDSAAIMAALKEEFQAKGFGPFEGSSGPGGLFDDPDGIEIQFLPAPDTLVTAAVPSDLVPGMQGLVVPQRVEYVELQVSDLARAVAYYRVLYGREKERKGNRATFAFRNGTRLVLEGSTYVYGKAIPRIVRYGIRVQPFDRAATEAGIVSLGGSVVNAGKDVFRLRDVDGIELDLVSG